MNELFFIMLLIPLLVVVPVLLLAQISMRNGLMTVMFIALGYLVAMGAALLIVNG